MIMARKKVELLERLDETIPSLFDSSPPVPLNTAVRIFTRSANSGCFADLENKLYDLCNFLTEIHFLCRGKVSREPQTAQEIATLGMYPRLKYLADHMRHEITETATALLSAKPFLVPRVDVRPKLGAHEAATYCELVILLANDVRPDDCMCRRVNRHWQEKVLSAIDVETGKPYDIFETHEEPSKGFVDLWSNYSRRASTLLAPFDSGEKWNELSAGIQGEIQRAEHAASESISIDISTSRADVLLLEFSLKKVCDLLLEEKSLLTLANSGTKRDARKLWQKIERIAGDIRLTLEEAEQRWDALPFKPSAKLRVDNKSWDSCCSGVVSDAWWFLGFLSSETGGNCIDPREGDFILRHVDVFKHDDLLQETIIPGISRELGGMYNRPAFPDFVPTDRQLKMLAALNGRKMTQLQLMTELDIGSKETFNGKNGVGGMKELLSCELVAKDEHKNGGYYRPNAPPKIVL